MRVHAYIRKSYIYVHLCRHRRPLPVTETRCVFSLDDSKWPFKTTRRFEFFVPEYTYVTCCCLRGSRRNGFDNFEVFIFVFQRVYASGVFAEVRSWWRKIRHVRLSTGVEGGMRGKSRFRNVCFQRSYIALSCVNSFGLEIPGFSYTTRDVLSSV